MALPPGAELGLKVLILLGVLALIGWGIYEGYKKYQEECPDGLFVCLGIEDPEGGGGGGGAGPGAGPGAGSRTPRPPANQSADYAECTKYFDEEDKTKTCYDPVAGKGGLRWFWSNTDGGKKCSDKTKFYKIEASSAVNDHNLTYTYLQAGGKTNGMIFENAKHITQKDGVSMNMKFNITPLDKDKKNLADPLMGQELDPGGSVTTDCTSIGTSPLDFQKIFDVKAPEDEAPPPPPPVDCVGSYDSNWSECTTTEANPICNVTFGNKEKIFNKTQDSAHGGAACPSEPQKQTCLVTKNCETKSAEEIKELPMCQYGGWYRADQNQYNCNTSCTSDPNNRDGGQTKWQKALQNVNFANGTMDCQPDANMVTEEFRPCAARPMCPINCQGGINPSPEVLAKAGCAHGSFGSRHDAYKTDKTYLVTTPAAHGGAACPHHHGKVITDYRYEKNGRWAANSRKTDCPP